MRKKPRTAHHTKTALSLEGKGKGEVSDQMMHAVSEAHIRDVKTINGNSSEMQGNSRLAAVHYFDTLWESCRT